MSNTKLILAAATALTLACTGAAYAGGHSYGSSGTSTTSSVWGSGNSSSTSLSGVIGSGNSSSAVIGSGNSAVIGSGNSASVSGVGSFNSVSSGHHY